MNVASLPLIDNVDGWHRTFPTLSKELLYRAVRTGELRAIRSGRRVLIPRSALLAWIGESPGSEMSIQS